jgi:hypothetical protein
MMPRVRPAPLSAWMLVGDRIAYAQPRAMTCSCHVGEGCGGMRAAHSGGKNWMITGTRFAPAGVVRYTSMFTSISG